MRIYLIFNFQLSTFNFKNCTPFVSKNTQTRIPLCRKTLKTALPLCQKTHKLASLCVEKKKKQHLKTRNLTAQLTAQLTIQLTIQVTIQLPKTHRAPRWRSRRRNPSTAAHQAHQTHQTHPPTASHNKRAQKPVKTSLCALPTPRRTTASTTH